jgi:hypothetical protein
MLFAAMAATPVQLRVLLSALACAGVLSSCSSHNDNPVVPKIDEHPAPTPMARLIGTPRVKVVFSGNLLESPGGGHVPAGTFSAVVYDSIGRRTFLGDVRLQGVPMRQAVDPQFSQPIRYVLEASELPPMAIGDSMRFEVVDGGAITPPFAYEMLPSYIVLPPDSTVVHESADLVLPWHGAIERVLVTITDAQSKRLRFNLQVENFTGEPKLFIPARDLAGLAVGELLVGTDVLDTEVIGATGANRQEFSFETRQQREWRLAP